MTRNDLREKLLNAGVRAGTFSLDGSLVPDAMIMDEAYGKWTVYYSDERGNREHEKVFDSEGAACQYLFVFVTEDPSFMK